MTASNFKKENTMTDHSISLSVHQITKVKTTKCVYDTFNAYDLSIESDDGRVIKITLFGVGSDEIAFENKSDKDMRST